jgi:uncharacterized integral membrane protein (TIGR02327 family)
MQYQGMQSILTLVLQLLFIMVTLRALRSFHLENFFRQSPEGLRLLIVLLAIAIGSACGSFFAEFFTILHGALNMWH